MTISGIKLNFRTASVQKFLHIQIDEFVQKKKVRDKREISRE